MYRILDANQEVRERRHQRRHPVYRKPELLATGPILVWTWEYHQAEGALEVATSFDRLLRDLATPSAARVVRVDAGPIANRRLSPTRRIGESCDRHRIDRGQLILHADRGSSLKSKAVELLLSEVGATQSHSRPQRVRRQPGRGSPVQKPEIPPRLPRTIRFHPGRQGLLSVAFSDWCNHIHYRFGPELAHCGDGPLRSN